MNKILLFFFLLHPPVFADQLIRLPGHQFSTSMSTWVEERDRLLIKQDKDFSCGAASIATILTKYHNRSTTESEVLKVLDKGDFKASFADMEDALPKLGFKGLGLAVSWRQLAKLKIPVIAYVKQRKRDHFTVISGVTETHVKISDPSLGNRVLTRGQFKKIWETREGELKGKVLAILPLSKGKNQVKQMFFKKPSVSQVPLDILAFRNQR